MIDDEDMPRGYYYMIHPRTHKVTEATSRDQAMKQFNNQKLRRVAEDVANGWWVSTVFLVMNHAFGGGPPMVFETMAFDRDDASVGEYADLQYRYSTWELAKAGHDLVVAAIWAGKSIAEIDAVMPVAP